MECVRAAEALHLPWLRSHGPIEATARTGTSSTPMAPFRGCEATAPLKPGRRRVGHQGCRPFRGCEATAPLKPEVDRRVTVPKLRLPWLRSHGPIEAMLTLTPPDAALFPFRGCEATAPLKRHGDVGHRVTSHTPFRGCEATAPLKLACRLDNRADVLPSVAAKPRPH